MNAPQRIIPAHSGHVFRSELVDAIARLEHWTLRVLRKAMDPDLAGNRAKIPQFITQRVKKVKALEEAHPRLFRSWPETIALLDKLEEYWILRTALVHAVLTATIAKGGDAFFTFESTTAGNEPGWERRKTFSEAEFSPIVRKAERLIDRLFQQLAD